MLFGKNFHAAANAHQCFLRYEANISLSKQQMKKLKRSRKAIRNSIVNYFGAQLKAPVPKFSTQGSARMKTMVLDRYGTYDVDLGIYFLTKPTVTPITLQKWVLDAVNGQTGGGAQHREKCIRVIYKGEFDIDLPIYYKTQNDKHPFLATKKGWMKSDPKELWEWFEKHIDNDGQLRRIVKYFKAWAASRGRKMPSGIAFTVWSAQCFKPNERDDIAFYETAKTLKRMILWNRLECKNPATPGDDFLSKLNKEQKNYFKQALKKLVETGLVALKQKSVLEAGKIWQTQLGNRFVVL